MAVNTAMSESSALHSDKLFSLACTISGLGLDAANGGTVNPPDNDELPLPDTGIELGPGLYFADGRRKVDYVLCYKYKKRRGSKSRLSIVSNGSIPAPSPVRRNTEADIGETVLVTAEVEESKLTDVEKVVMRQEFEAGLVEAGLHIERDKERSQGIGFIRLHIPWPILSRKAELQKIKVPVKKKCELRQKTGIAGVWDSLITEITKPFEPDIPDCDINRDSQTRVRFKTLKHAFIRDKLHLYDIKSTQTLFDNATRSRIVAEIISRTICTQTCQTTGITTLLAQGVYDSAFPLHDGSFTRRGRRDQRNDRQILHEEWANYGVMHKYQPVDLIRKYFGEQIGLYFAWLGVYTQLLIPPSLLGIAVFMYGIFTIDTNVPSQETCDLNITMCPLCDRVCDYWRLSSVCSLARATYLFDNGVTVLFAIFMSLWAACFLEHWKRRQMCLKHCWDLTSLEDEEERVQEEARPEYETVLQEKKEKVREKNTKKAAGNGGGTAGEMAHMLASQREPESLDVEDHLLGYLVNVSTLLLLIVVTFSAVFGVAMYRVCMLSVWSMNPDPEAKASVRMTVTTTGIILNMLVVLVLEEVYGAIAVWLTELELPKTEAEFEERLIFKSFFLKSMNAFAPIFYVAFFKGRFSGRPGDYIYIFGNYRVEECAPPGCLIELCIQLSMIMLGKQLIQNNVFEIVIPKLKKMYRTMQEEKGKKRAAGDEESSAEQKRPKQQFDKDFALEPFEGVTPEYMEMIIQYGFVSLFVASFPLAPAFALLNNVIEIRLDAAKFVTEIRRPDAVRCKDIGIWYNILCGISKFSVITNAFVISFTSEFIPRMVFQFMYSTNGTMNGFTEHSLSYFNVSNFPAGTEPTSTLFTEVSICRYKGYRDPPWASDAYTLSKQYWSVLAARLAFVIFFQNLAMFLSMLVAWMIPDVSRSLRDQLKKESVLLMEYLLDDKQEGRAERSQRRASSRCPGQIDIVVETVAEEEEEEEKGGEREEEEVLNLDGTGGRNDSVVELGRFAEEQGDDGDGLAWTGAVGGGQWGEDGGSGGGDDEETDVNKRDCKEGQWIDDHAEEVEIAENKEAVEISQCKEVEEISQCKEEEKEPEEEEYVAIDLDSFMDQLGLLDDEPSPMDVELPQPGSKQEFPEPQDLPAAPAHPSKRGSSHSLSASSATEPKLFSPIAPPPIDPGSRAKTRCSTLPSRHRGSGAAYSLPRPSHSTSLTRLQQMAQHAPLVPLRTPGAPVADPFSLPRIHPSMPSSSPGRPQPLTLTQPQAKRLTQSLTHKAAGPTELFLLKGPPPQENRSRAKGRCSTLPASSTGTGSAKPSHSTSFTQLSPRELRRDTQL